MLTPAYHSILDALAAELWSLPPPRRNESTK